MTGTRYDWSTPPSRRVITGSLVGALVGGSLLGLVIGVVSPFSPPHGKEITTAAAATGSPTTGPTQPPVTAAAPSPSKAKPRAVTTTTLSALPVPQGFIDHPENDRTMFLATLESMDSGNPQHVVIWVKKADLVKGDNARHWYQSQGQEPRDVAVVPRQDAQAKEMVLQGDAVFS